MKSMQSHWVWAAELLGWVSAKYSIFEIKFQIYFSSLRVWCCPGFYTCNEGYTFSHCCFFVVSIFSPHLWRFWVGALYWFSEMGFLVERVFWGWSSLYKYRRIAIYMKKWCAMKSVRWPWNHHQNHSMCYSMIQHHLIILPVPWLWNARY